MPEKITEKRLFLHALKNTGAAIRYNRKIIIAVMVCMMFIFSGIVALAANKTPKTKPSDWKENPGFINTAT